MKVGSRVPGNDSENGITPRPKSNRDGRFGAKMAGKPRRYWSFASVYNCDIRTTNQIDMLTATCHCGAVRVTVPRKPRRLTSCNCSICHRLGTLWAYYPAANVKVEAGRGATESYVWGDKLLAFVRCKTCGCVTHWRPLKISASSRMGVNARGFEREVIEGVRVRRLDGASTWKFLD
jgi:hypothetical protein